MTVQDAQADLRRAYVGGGPGVLVSALVWFAAAFAARDGVAAGFVVLFLGGMLIFPAATALSRVAFRRGAQAKDNPLGLTALECTIAMLGGIFAAWLFLPVRPEHVFPLVAIAVGTHYLVFKTVYGDRTYWLLGALITAIGFVDIYWRVTPPGGTVLAVGVVELAFAILLTARALQEPR